LLTIVSQHPVGLKLQQVFRIKILGVLERPAEQPNTAQIQRSGFNSLMYFRFGVFYLSESLIMKD
jgi:hypothetical protein